MMELNVYPGFTVNVTVFKWVEDDDLSVGAGMLISLIDGACFESDALIKMHMLTFMEIKIIDKKKVLAFDEKFNMIKKTLVEI